MSRLESLVKKHQPLHIYSITEQSNIYRELQAYAQGLDELFSELDIMLRECFYATAETYGIERAEKLWGKVRDDLSTDKRRQMLLGRSAFGYDDFTCEGVSGIIAFLGIDADVYEYPQMMRLVVDTKGTAYTQGQKNWICSQLNALLPAHLDIDILWGDFCFDDIDRKNLTFDSIDARGLEWSQIDIYEE